MKKYISICLLIAWMGVIYYFSSQTRTVSSNLSNSLLEEIAILFQFNNATEFVLKYAYLFRKLAHFGEYFILGLLMANLCKQYSNKNVIVVVFVLCALYATSDEIHQYFVSGRYFALTDILIDSIGALFGNLSFNLFTKICSQEKKH